MYYVVHLLSNLSKVAIHLELHAHPISEGNYGESFKEMKCMVTEEVLLMPNITSFLISLAINKTFLSHNFFNEDEEVPMELLKGEKLNQAMSMFVPFIRKKTCIFH
jgi:hypothetical protein